MKLWLVFETIGLTSTSLCSMVWSGFTGDLDLWSQPSPLNHFGLAHCVWQAINLAKTNDLKKSISLIKQVSMLVRVFQIIIVLEAKV